MNTRTSFTLLAIVLAFIVAAGIAAVAQEVGTLADDPGTSQVLRQRSNANGKLIKGTAIGGNKINDGHYWVRFPIPVMNCIFSATLSAQKSVITKDDPGMITVQPRATDDRDIIVTTFNQFGRLNDHGFDVIVACPEPAPASPAP